ncbi:MAG: response regulator [Firmicutes bacterium]|nr:response regulator [Bacillota bacterium]
MEYSIKKTVLLAEDDEDAREIARVILELYGYEVIEAVDGVSLLHKSMEVNPDIVILDLSLTPGGGIQLMLQLRKNVVFSTVPVLAYTAMSSIDDMEMLKREGFDGVIPKPCKPEEIVDTVRKFVG